MNQSPKHNPNILKVLGIAVGLPSSILGVFFIVYYLVSKDILSSELALILILAIVGYSFYLMLRYANRR